MTEEHVPVLVVGAGLAGLSAALFLGRHGIRPLLVERHPGTSTQPKARGQYPHTMEALRIGGVDQQLRAAGLGGDTRMRIVIAESVTGRQFHSFVNDTEVDLSRYSNAGWAMASQEQAEPILAARAVELGAQLRFSTELESFEQDADGVTAVLRDRNPGGSSPEKVSTVRADYLVAADGHRSPVRAALGIGTHGRGTLGHSATILFKADLGAALGDLKFALYHLRDRGTLVTTDDRNLFVLSFPFDPAKGERLADFTGPRCTELVRAAVGTADLDVTVLDVAETTTSLSVADRFSAGRVHLIGDAVRVVPPTGGLGGNTAVLDGFYLAWKLAAVLSGQAGPGLLDSHDAERRPVSDLVAEQQFANLVERGGSAPADEPVAEKIAPATQFFGYRYASGAVVREEGDDGALLEDADAPTGRPGSRAPHIPLVRDGQPLSTTELFGRGFVLLTGAAGPEWESAAAQASARLGIDLPVHRISGAAEPGVLVDPDNRWSTAYGITATGAVLVRPDRFVAWRCADSSNTDGLERALRVVLDRPAG